MTRLATVIAETTAADRPAEGIVSSVGSGGMLIASIASA
jgi:hypothetical protein